MNHTNVMETDVLIIGAGLAGLSVALNLPKSTQICILSKEALHRCSSYLAQGGIAGLLTADDSVTTHTNDTLIAGDGLCHPTNAEKILRQGMKAIGWLCQQGVPFTREFKQHTFNNVNSNDTQCPIISTSVKNHSQAHLLDELHLTREGGHSHRRIAHADDATGKHIMDTLLARAKMQKNIKLLPQHEAIHLLTNKFSQPLVLSDYIKHPHPTQNAPNHPDAHCKNDKSIDDYTDKSSKEYSSLSDFNHNKHHQHTHQYCYGAVVFNQADNHIFHLHAKAVVLASGGLGQMFKQTTAPSPCIGDGIMMAWQAGCQLANLEFVQFHPTGLAIKDNVQKTTTDSSSVNNFLISEAVRGEGGILYCPVSGKRFMQQIDERAELAPRDIVARAIYQQGNVNGLGYVNLDISHRPAKFIREHFPQIYQYCLNLGLDITKEPIPVAPTAHYSCGGVLTTAEGLSDVVALYAVGEVAYSGLHGANRLASNSLLECVVIGQDIAKHLSRAFTNIDSQSSLEFQQFLLHHWQFPRIDTRLKPTHDFISIASDNNSIYDTGMLKHLSNIGNYTSDVKAESQEKTPTTKNDFKRKITELKQLINDSMGIVRSRTKLEAALEKIDFWQSQCIKNSNKAANLSSLDVENIRWQRLMTLAKLMLQSAINRQESRGGHYRIDFANKSELARVSIIPSISYHATSYYQENNQTIVEEI